MIGGSSPSRGWEIFLPTTASRPAMGLTQTPFQWVPGALSLGVKQGGHKADHSPPSSAEVNNAWNYTSTPHLPSRCDAHLKHRDNFTFTTIITITATVIFIIIVTGITVISAFIISIIIIIIIIIHITLVVAVLLLS
jgi:hypothetical protein